MKIPIRLAAACVAFAAIPVFADHTLDHCGSGVKADGMRARVKTLNDQMDRIEWTADRAKQRELINLHMKHVQEGLSELRKRDMPAACRLELLSSMMESMVRQQQVAHEEGR